MPSVDLVKEALSFGFTPLLLVGKKPVEEGYVQKYNSISREDLLKEAKRRYDSNVGIFLKDILCIDVDLQHDGMQNWERLLQENGISDIDSLETPIVKTGSRGRHYYFKLTPEFEKCNEDLADGKEKIGGIDVKRRTGFLVYPGSVYQGCGKEPHKCGEKADNCLFRGNVYKWIKSPADIPIAPIPDWLKKYLIVTHKRAERKEDRLAAPPSFIKECIPYLKKRADTYHEWRDTVWCLKSLGCGVEVAHEFSRLSRKYDSDGVEKLWDDYDPDKGKWTKASLFKWLKEDMDEDDFEEFCEKHLNDPNDHNILLRAEKGLGLLFVDEAKDILKIINSKGNGYMYNHKTRLWDKVYPEHLCRIVSDILEPVVLRIVEKAQAIDAIRGTSDSELYKPVLNRVYTIAGTSCIARFASPSLEDYNFQLQLNRTADLLPIKNGKVLCLRTLEVRDRTASDYFTFECPVEYKPAKEYKVAEDFFKGICCGDEEYVYYLRKLLAYYMSGAIDDRKFYIFVGSGMNGKSTLIDLMRRMMGDFYKSVSESVIIAKDKNSSCTPELVPLMTARLGVLPENRENVKLCSERLKAFTGEDDFVCRPLYSEEINFVTQAKLVLMTNNLPKFNSTDKGMGDRVVVLPFNAVFKNDSRIKERLRQNLDEIFTYIIQTIPEFWKEMNLNRLPSVVKQEIQRYMKDNNLVEIFVDELCEQNPDYQERGSFLYERYKQWAEENGFPQVDSKDVYKVLDKTFSRVRRNFGLLYKGLRLRTDFDDEKEE